MTQKPMYQTIVGDVSTLLTAPYTAGTDTTVSVENTLWLPAAPNSCTIAKSDKSAFVTIRYTGKTSTTLTGVDVIQGSSIEALTDKYLNGSELSKPLAQDDLQSIQDNIIDHEQRIETLEQGGGGGGIKGVKVAGTELQKDSDGKVDIPIGGTAPGVVKSGTEAIISSDGSIDISTATTRLENAIDAVSDDLSDHIDDMGNPHNVTKAQVGLGDVDNTSDADKPISTAAQAALDLKADDSDLQAHISDKDNPHEVDKTDVGLGNVDNTSDANKPISTATQNALDAKADEADVTAALEGKVDKETGKGLSDNNFTTAYKNKVDNTANSLDAHVADTDNPHEVTASQIGVEDGAEVNVIEGVQVNGSDLPVTSKKVNVPIASTSGLGVVMIGDNLTIDSTGKVSATASAQVQADWDETDSSQPSFIKGKPELGTASEKDVPASGNASSSQVVLGSDTRLTDNRSPTAHASSHVSGTDVIPNATTSANGLMSSTDKSKLNGIEAQAQKNVKPDWDATAGSAQEVLNKPTAVSEFTNDANYQTDTQVSSTVSTHNSSTSAHSDIRQSVSAEVSRAEGEEQSLQNQIDALASRTDVVDVVATYADLDLSKYLVNDIVKVMQDETHSNAISYYKVVETGGVKSWSYLGSQGPFYTKSEADNYFVPQQRTINGKSLANNVTLDADDVNALPYDTKLSDLEQDSTHRTVTDAEKTAWNGKQAALTFDNTPTEDSSNPVKSGGVYSALSGKADTSALTSHTSNTSNPHSVTKSQVGLGNVDNTSDANKPVSTATQSALDGKVDKVTGKGLSTNDFTTTLKNKLDGIESGAQVNVQADWNATTAATGAVKNKPELGDAASKNVGTTAGTVCAGNDSRLSDSRTPKAHASTHAAGAADEITPAAIGAEPSIGTKGTAFNKDFGTSAGTVCQGNDTRLSDARTPTAHNHAASDINSGTLDSARLPSATTSAKGGVIVGTGLSVSSGTVSVSYGTAAGTACQGNDSRLSNSRTPTSHASTATTYGVSSASNYGHPKATSTTPSALGTASVGTDNGLYARGDHVHHNPITISTYYPTPAVGVDGDVWFIYER